jgi:hypothetical protein
MSKVDSINFDALDLKQVKPYLISNLYYQIKGGQENRETSPAVMWGPPGIGKSMYLGEICRDEGFGLVTLYLSNVLVHQMTGLPQVVQIGDKSKNKFVPWSVPDIFDFRNMTVTPSNKDGSPMTPEQLSKIPIVMFLDDIHLCGPDIQKFLFQLLTQRAINKNRLPSNVVILLAGNRAEDRAGFRQMNAGISSRTTHYQVKGDPKRWIEDFAIPNEVHPYIVSFIQYSDIKLNSTPLENGPWANPRTWTEASYQIFQLENMINRSLTSEEMYVIIESKVGTEFATDFYAYTELIAKWDAEGIMDGHIGIVDVKGGDQINSQWQDYVDVSNMPTMEAYALMTACVGEIQKRLKGYGYNDNKDTNKIIKFVRETILAKMIKYHRAIIPLGVKILILGEQNEKGKSTLIKKLLVDEAITKALVDIL